MAHKTRGASRLRALPLIAPAVIAFVSCGGSSGTGAVTRTVTTTLTAPAPANASNITFEGQGPMSAEQYLAAGAYRTSFDSCAQSATGNDLQNAADNQYGTFIRLTNGGTASIRFTGNYILFLNATCDWQVTFTAS